MDVDPLRLTVYPAEGLAPEQVERLRRVANTCPVRRALEAGFSFNERIELVDRAVSPAETAQ